MRTVTLQQLRDDVVNQADLVSVGADTFITTTELDRWIVQSSRKFAGMLVGAFGARYRETFYQFHTEVGTAQYTLPANFWQMHQAAVIIGGELYNIYPATKDELSWGEFVALVSDDGCQTPYDYLDTVIPRYALIGNTIEFAPVPQEMYCVKIRYISTAIEESTGATDLASASHTINGENGWEQWIVWDCCVKAAIKQREDPNDFRAERAVVEADIQKYASKRDRQPVRMRNTYDEQYYYGRHYTRGPWRVP